jgi:S-DNA-T family DNA segregation ATPase FtsK/SpoIIIE
MERRYQLFADAGARNVTTYNQRVEKVMTGEMPVEKLCPSKAGQGALTGSNGEEMWLLPEGDEQPDELPTPDEAALCGARGRRVRRPDDGGRQGRRGRDRAPRAEGARRGHPRDPRDPAPQRRRHHRHDQGQLPARIAFKVSQREDSKTILGRQGAEHLLGMGDMLMIPPGASDLKRVHSAYISEDEVTALATRCAARASRFTTRASSSAR